MQIFLIYIYIKRQSIIIWPKSQCTYINHFVSAFYWNLNCHSKNIHLILVVVRYVAGGIAYDTFLFFRSVCYDAHKEVEFYECRFSRRSCLTMHSVIPIFKPCRVSTLLSVTTCLSFHLQA